VSAAVVPVKRLAATKSRLFEDGDPKAREALALAMLRDVIAALRAAKRVDRVVVATPDEDVAQAARAAGAEALVRDDPGLNPALEAAARSLALPADEPLLVVLGDVAGVLPEDVDALFAALDALGGRGAVLAPSNDGGTSALLRAPAQVIPACFGRDSARRHREAAAERHVPFRELPLASLALDLDVPEDVERFSNTTGGGAATRAALRELGPLGPGDPA
jgi:2-phospho-L-lactate guanylyltransferase